jgi:hypothetical protein
VTEFPKRSLPVKSSRIVAPAALNVLWPEMNSGKGGVGKLTDWHGTNREGSEGEGLSVPGDQRPWLSPAGSREQQHLNEQRPQRIVRGRIKRCP